MDLIPKAANQVRMKIGILEDEYITAFGAEMMLKDLGHQVLYKETCAKRMQELVYINPPDIALIDLRLQIGFDGLKAVRTSGSLQGMQTVIMTAVSKPEILALANHFGAVAIVDKMITSR